MLTQYSKINAKPGLVALMVAALLAACASPPKPVVDDPVAKGRQTAAGGIYKIGTPYKIEGLWYYPQEDPNLTGSVLPHGMARNLMAGAPPMAKFSICGS